MKHKYKRFRCCCVCEMHRAETSEHTPAVSEDHFLVINKPAKARKLNVIPVWCLDSDVFAVPIIVHPVFLLFDFDELNFTQVLSNTDVIRVHLTVGL